MTKGAFKQSWADVCKRAGISDLTFHDLRREAGSRFDEAGLTKGEHDLMMGHAGTDMTSLYIHGDLNRIQDKLDRYTLDGNTEKELQQDMLEKGLANIFSNPPSVQAVISMLGNLPRHQALDALNRIRHAAVSEQEISKMREDLAKETYFYPT
jgi:hypothetical protein